MMSLRRPADDPRNYHILFLETGLIVSLTVLLILFKIPLNTTVNRSFVQRAQETVKMEDIVQTTQKQLPPPPPVPQVPEVVPDNEIIRDIPLNMNAELNINASLPLPPAPPIAKVQDKDKNDANKIFVSVEHMPELIGGLENLQNEIHYPELALKANIEGRVIIEFYVDEHGNVRNAHVIRGIGAGCDEEALRVVKAAKFKPGMQRGRFVKVQYVLPIVFKLQN